MECGKSRALGALLFFWSFSKPSDLRKNLENLGNNSKILVKIGEIWACFFLAGAIYLALPKGEC
jgi:hypothetical protein